MMDLVEIGQRLVPRACRLKLLHVLLALLCLKGLELLILHRGVSTPNMTDEVEV